MKIRIILFSAIIATTALVSCGKKGLSEETKNAMTAFEADWKATGEAIKGWESTMNSTFGEMNTMMTEAQAMDASKLKGAAKTSVDSLHAVCAGITTNMETVKSSYAATVASWEADEKAYTDWKTSGKDTPEAEVISGLEGYKAKFAEYQATMATWNTTLADMKANCMATCEAIKGTATM